MTRGPSRGIRPGEFVGRGRHMHHEAALGSIAISALTALVIGISAINWLALGAF
jgi:hypothetical protein